MSAKRAKREEEEALVARLSRPEPTAAAAAPEARTSVEVRDFMTYAVADWSGKGG